MPDVPRLVQLRIARALSQEDLAALSGVSSRTISNLERGVFLRPRTSTLRRIGRALDLDAAEMRDWLKEMSLQLGEDGLREEITELPEPLVGRTVELQELNAAIRTSPSRMLSMVGPAGIGKAALARAVAHEFARDEGWVVALIALDDADDAVRVEHLLGDAVRGLESRRRGGSAERSVLFLCHCEAVAPTIGRAILGALTRYSALTIVAATRHALGVRRQKQFVVRSLSIDEAIHLLERLKSEQHVEKLTPELIMTMRSIVEGVDCNPFAISMLARRLQIVPASRVLEMVRAAPLDLLTNPASSLPTRHDDARESIAASYSLLDRAHARVLQAVGVFPGGCTSDGLAFVTGTEAIGLVDSLDVLHAHHLVEVVGGVRDAARVVAGQLTRAFVSELANQEGRSTTLRFRHANCMLDIVEHLDTTDRVLDRERDNIFAAMDWSRVQGAVALAARLCAALPIEWWCRSANPTDGLSCVLGALAACKTMPNGSLKARLLMAQAWLAIVTGNDELVEQAVMEAQSLIGTAMSLEAQFETVRRYCAVKRSESVRDNEFFTRALGDIKMKPGDRARLQGRVRTVDEWLQTKPHEPILLDRVAAFETERTLLALLRDDSQSKGVALKIEALEWLGHLFFDRRQYDVAARATALATSLRVTRNVPGPVSRRAGRAGVMKRLRDVLGEAFDGHYRWGLTADGATFVASLRPLLDRMENVNCA